MRATSESSSDSRDARAPSPGPIATVYMLIFAQAFAWGGGISTLLPLYGGEALHLTPEAIGRSMAIAFWVEVCLLFPVGWAADVWGKTRVVLPGFVAMLVGTLAVPFTHGVWGYGIAFIFLVGGMSVWMAAPALLAEQLSGGFRGKGAGLYRLVTDLGIHRCPRRGRLADRSIRVLDGNGGDCGGARRGHRLERLLPAQPTAGLTTRNAFWPRYASASLW